RQRDAGSSYPAGLPGACRVDLPSATGQAMPARRSNMRFRGKVLRAGQVVVDPAIGEVREELRPDGIRAWAGWFTVPPGANVGPGDDYRLLLDDGRAADIRVLSVNTRADFRLNGGWDS